MSNLVETTPLMGRAPTVDTLLVRVVFAMIVEAHAFVKTPTLGKSTVIVSYQRSSYTNKQYTGGHHPVDDDVLTVNPEKNPDLYEDADRLCDNCGQMKRFLKKGAYEAFLKEEAKKPGNHWLLW
ncbi:hypothetical protein VNI00_008305 [Paramarasmius palmivorus]|uniref:Uncharacterized protein n=1 Tax=Paramarasmius palmivorus TaxID=297713 RepID=A0AAW0CUU7_9AGAR